MFDANFTGRVTINGSGTQSRSFIRVSKVSQVLAQLIETKVPSGIYNLSDKNLEILDILEVLKKIYPDLEYFHINQHITMQELKVEPKSKLYQYIPLTSSDFESELREFKEQFAF